jgi:predicted acyl esterase
VARRIAAGSRLRVYVGAPNSIYVQKNYNSGGVVAHETGKDARVARVTLHHDRQRPSHVELPVVTH